MSERVVGTISDVLDQYDLIDGAAVWQAICWDEPVRNPTTRKLVRLVARKEDKQGDLWIVREVELDVQPARKGIMR